MFTMPEVRRALRYFLPVAVGLLGAWVGMLAWGRSTVDVGPFHVQLASSFGPGQTRIALPPFGQLVAGTHDAPLRLTATLQEVDVTALTDRLRDSSLDDLVDQVQRDGAHRALPFGLRLLGVSMAGALGLSLLVFRTRWRPVVAAVATALVVVAGSEVAAWQTFQPSAFLTPTFSGSLALAPKLIGPAQTALGRIDDFRHDLQQVVSGAIRVYTSIQEDPITNGEEIRVLHISDIHLSPLGISFAQKLAKAFDVDFVIDTGDLTSFGTPIEAWTTSAIPGFDRPYVFVRGNHDSMSLQEDVAREPGALVLDGATHRVDGLTVYGLGDPVFTPNKLTALDDARFASTVRSVGPRILSDVTSGAQPPDIVAVHDDRMAEAVAGYVPLVISGHFHQSSARVIDGTLFLRVGSTGGAGANVYTQAGGVPLSAEILYFSKTDPPKLVAWDVIEQSPVTGNLTVRRHLVSREFGDLQPSPSPTSSPIPSPSEAPTESPSPVPTLSSTS
jgi:predicted MPP superfamily phosphohydrolase